MVQSSLFVSRGLPMVDSAYPPGADAWKGPAVRRLRRYVSWVQYVVRQYSLHLPFRRTSMLGCTISTKGPWYLYLWCTSCRLLRLAQEGSYVQTGSVLKASRHEASRARQQTARTRPVQTVGHRCTLRKELSLVMLECLPMR